MTSRVTYQIIHGRHYAIYPTGHVYFATFVGENTPVKVGWSSNPWWRVIELGYSFREKIQVRHTIDVARGTELWGTRYDSLEQRMHRALASRRVDVWTLEPSKSGEWYLLSEDDVALALRFGQDLVAHGRAA